VSEQFKSLFQLQSPKSSPSQTTNDKAMKQSQQLLDSFHSKRLNDKIYQVRMYIHIYVHTCAYIHIKNISCYMYTYIR